MKSLSTPAFSTHEAVSGAMPEMVALEKRNTMILLSPRRRAAHRAFIALGIFAFGMVLNSVLWLLGRAEEYQLLPVSLLSAALVYGILWVLD